MTMVASGQIDLGGTATSGGLSRSINFEFGYGANLGAYRGLLYTNASGSSVFQFPNTLNSIGMNAFYNSRKIPSGSATYSSSGNFSVPAYNTLTVIVRAAGGQGGGSRGNNTCVGLYTSGSQGASGGNSSFGPYVFAPGGGGGGGAIAQSTSGFAGNTQSGYGYGGNFSNFGGSAPDIAGVGGGGGVSVSALVNPIAGGNGPQTNSTVSVTVGTAIFSENGGNNFANLPYFGCQYVSRASDGGVGGNGSVEISWS